jgi:predicted ArsR family transcriptional regulator
MVALIDGAAINLSEQDERKRSQHIFRRVDEQVADADEQTVFAKARCVRETGKREELNLDLRQRGSRLQKKMGSLEDRL